jgi:hypothetical protein
MTGGEGGNYSYRRLSPVFVVDYAITADDGTGIVCIPRFGLWRGRL